MLTYVNFHRSLHRDFDQHLMHELSVLLPLVEHEDGAPTFSRFEAMRGVAYQTDGVFGTYVRLLDPAGHMLYESPNLEGHGLLPVALPPDPVEFVIGREWEGGPIRSHYHPLFNADGHHDGWLEVSGFEWSMHQELDRLIRTFTVGILVAFLVSIAGGYVLARRSLNPVVAITRVANEIRAGSLHRRIPGRGGASDELSRLTETINALLERIEASFQRERRFSANAAHELMTPLASVRGEIELALRSGSVPTDTATGLKAAIDDIDRMNQIVRSLLQLSSVERLEESDFVRLDAAEVVRERLARFDDRALVEGRHMDSSLEPGCFVKAHPDGLARVIDNLVDNAMKYTDADGHVRVELHRSEGHVVLTVADDGIGLSAEDAVRVFDRFYRAPGEAERRPGSGLGLAIVQAVVHRFGGTVAVKSPGLNGGTRFTVRLAAA